MNSYEQIRKLIYSYNWYLDQGMFDELGALFNEADIYYGEYLGISKNGKAFGDSFKTADHVYAPDNTPRTMHLGCNPIINVDEEAGTATAQHYTVVIQGIPGKMDPQVLVMDLKYDTFKRKENGEWVFASRKMGNRAAGDLVNHQKNPDRTGAYWALENTLFFPECRDI